MSLIINRPTECPQQFWDKQPDGSLKLKSERRPASYEVFSPRDGTLRVEEIGLAVLHGYGEVRDCPYP
jgi:type III restriction enzyme